MTLISRLTLQAHKLVLGDSARNVFSVDTSLRAKTQLAQDTGDPFLPDLPAALGARMPLTLFLAAHFMRAQRTRPVGFLSADSALVQVFDEAKVALTEFEQPRPASIVVG